MTHSDLARLPILALLVGLGASPAPPAAAQETPPTPAELRDFQDVYIAEDDPSAASLEPRAQAQIEAARKALEVFHDFRFEDAYRKSGITFSHRPTDDGLVNYAMVHYDHGNGVAVADVDGDDRYDVYFVSQFGSNELYRNLGGGKFENITASAGVGMADRISTAPAFGDIDNDGDPDLLVTSVRTGNVLFENDGSGRFKDISKAAGVDYVGHSSGAVFLDYDRDGLLDLFVTNVGVYTQDVRGREGYYVGLADAFSGHLKPERYERSILYRNLGGNKFADVSEQTGLVERGWNGDATLLDFNRDGYPDLYVPNMQGDDHYWENQGGERFVEKTAEYFPKTSWGAMGVKAFDYDNNGLVDLMTTDMHSDMADPVGPERYKLKSRVELAWTDEQLQGGANNIFGNSFYRQVEPGKFEEISDQVGAENYWPWGLSAEDLNADGWDDVLIVSSMNYPYHYQPNTLLLNNAGKGFVESEFLLGIEPRVHGLKMRPWFPLDCSGGPSTHRVCAESGATGKLLVWGALGSRTAAIFDLDDDGDNDIVTGEFNAQPQILISDLAAKRKINYLKVRLRGTKSNRDGIGARVTVVAGDKRYVKVNDGKSGYLSHSVLPLYFGLGAATEVDRIEVEWPSGVAQVVDPVGPIHRLVEVAEPSD